MYIYIYIYIYICIYIYSQTCVKRPLKGNVKSGLLKRGCGQSEVMKKTKYYQFCKMAM